MATKQQRAVSFLTAALNAAPTAAQIARAKAAFADPMKPDAPDADIVERFVADVSGYIIGRVMSYEAKKDADAAFLAKQAAVKTDFQETP